MLPDPRALAERVSAETGLGFTGTSGRDDEGRPWLELRPADYPPSQTFTLRTVVGWRRIEVYFRPGLFAGELLESMRGADETGRQSFCAVLGGCLEAGADVDLSVNGAVRSPDDDSIWAVPWRSLELVVRRGMLAINEGNRDTDMHQIALWSSQVAAAVFALLPIESPDTEQVETAPDVVGLPEGAMVRVEVNRYERDRRNRAAALAIHGHLCKACGLDMGKRYGPDATGLVEVHHLTPVSEVGLGHIVNPKTDLVPLCPNCHTVAHRRSPPFTVDELREMQRTTDLLSERLPRGA